MSFPVPKRPAGQVGAWGSYKEQYFCQKGWLQTESRVPNPGAEKQCLGFPTVSK